LVGIEQKTKEKEEKMVQTAENMGRGDFTAVKAKEDLSPEAEKRCRLNQNTL